MKTHLVGIAMPALLVAALMLGACGRNVNEEGEKSNGNEPPPPPPPTTVSRGSIDIKSCGSGKLMDVDSSAVAALYFDSSGQVVGEGAEDLSGTTDKKMCPTPAPSVPGACQSGYCAQLIAGRRVCMRC